MKLSHIVPIAVVLAVVAVSLAARIPFAVWEHDAANTVNATQSAGQRVARSAN